MQAEKIPVIVIFGPTGTGKTSLSEALFSKNSLFKNFSQLNSCVEVVSADSMQVYKGLNIGTAKPSKSSLEGLPHHLIDVVDPKENFGLGDFLDLADKTCKDIFIRNKIPALVGGAGFYIKGFLFGLPSTPKACDKTREKLSLRMETEGPENLMRELETKDPVYAKKININDHYRILRALEVYEASGKPLSSFKIPNKLRKNYDFLLINLERPRKELYLRIRKRVLQMIDEGLESEVKNLLSCGYTVRDPGLKAIGYNEFFCKEKNCLHENLEEVINKIISNTCKYAKRQSTFIKPIKDFINVDADDYDKVYSLIIDFLSTKLR